MKINLEIPLTLRDVCSSVRGEFKALPEEIIKTVTTDSREAGEGELFLALSEDTDARKRHTEEAKKKGALTLSDTGADITVTDTADALLRLAGYYKGLLKSLKTTIGITGSVGKTTTKEFMKTLFSGIYVTHATMANFNNRIGMPLSILAAPKNTEILILEMGMNHSGEIRRLNECARADIAVITNVGTSHIGNLGSREAIAEAKREILELGALPIIPYGEPLLSSVRNAITFSKESADANIGGRGFVESRDGIKASFLINGQDALKADLHVRGEQNLSCLAAAIASAVAFGLPISAIERQISLITQDKTRQTTQKVGKIFLLNDSYNASFESMCASFELLFNSREYPTHAALLGDVLELGDMTEDIHSRLGYIIGSKRPDDLFLCGEYADAYARGVVATGYPPERMHTFGRDEIGSCAEKIKECCTENELLLVKGSHSSSVSRVVEILKKELMG